MDLALQCFDKCEQVEVSYSCGGVAISIFCVRRYAHIHRTSSPRNVILPVHSRYTATEGALEYTWLAFPKEALLVMSILWRYACMVPVIQPVALLHA